MKKPLTVSQFKKLNGFDIPDKRWKIKDGKILCGRCNLNSALFKYHEPVKAWLREYCKTCSEEVNNMHVEVLGNYPEMIPEDMKEKRKEYFNTMLQPTRDEYISKEFVEAYPDKAHKLFKGEERNARYVFQDTPGWSTRQRSK